MKLLVDMNLPPAFAEVLAATGFDAVHWSAIGSPKAADGEILALARRQGFVLLTHDLDFSAILAASGDDAPSVVQLRSQDLFSALMLRMVLEALSAHAGEIERGALLSVNEAGTRVRVLPLRRE